MEKVKVIFDGEVARISLNRPEKKNALSYQVLDELREAVDAVKSSSARVLILSGEGDTFCAGMDREVLMNLTQKGGMSDQELLKSIEDVQKLIYDLRMLKIPVIAAVQRYAIGGGMQLALTADIRIATPGTIFYLREPEFGIIPDMGALQILPRLVGDGIARDMVFTRRQITAEEGKAIGLVNGIYQDLEEGIKEYTQKLLSVPAYTIAEAKAILERSWYLSFEESIRENKEAQFRSIKESLRRFQKL
ncbi:MAG: enoyl-CoA hydratase/isomerase family protein [Archaeoglobaceae archaeon]|nr:enoyl-CoA hydratase/isomerase family protein [Archaeoglobales archaeon]